MRIDLDRLSGRPGNAAAPERFQPRDVVVLVDPDRLDVTVAELAEGPRS